MSTRLIELIQRIWLPAVALLVCYALFRDPDVSFRSSDAKWADSEVQFKGRRFEEIAVLFELYKLECTAPQAVLLRTTRQDWFNVFAWPSFIGDRKWRVPYGEAVPEIGNYYPPSNQKNCYNEPSAPVDFEAAESKARAYLNQL